MKLGAFLVLAACSGVSVPTTRHASSTDHLERAGDVAILSQGRSVFAFEKAAASITGASGDITRVMPPRGSWQTASALTGPDHERWTVAIADGVLWRITSDGNVEDVRARLGADGARVMSVDANGRAFALGLLDGFAVSHDGEHVSRFHDKPVPFIAVTASRVALGRRDAIEVYDFERADRTSYPAENVSAVAFVDAGTEHPRLVVLSDGAVYVEGRGALLRVPTPPIRQIAVSESRLWMLGKTALYSLEAASPVRIEARVADTSRIFNAGGGDVWLTAGTQATRYTLDATSQRESWNARVAPLFERACSKCHRPGGDADLDLSTSDAWRRHADVIRHELVTHDMPPEGIELSNAEREQLVRWLAR